MVLRELNVGLLQSVGSNKSVDLGGVDVVQFLYGILNLMFVGTDINNEDKGVVIFDVLHGALSGEGVLQDRILKT